MAVPAFTNTTKVNTRPKAILYLVLAAVLWSIGGVLIKSINGHPLAIAGVRSALSAITFLVILGKPKFTWSRAQLGAAAGYAGTVIFFVLATKATTAANAIFLQYTAPIYVALLSHWLLKEKTRALDWVTVFIVIAGMGLFFLDDLSSTGFIGNIYGILAGVCFAFEAIFLRMQKDGSPWESVLLGNVITAIIGVPCLMFAWPSMIDWASLIVLGVVQLGFSYILYTKAIVHTTALEAILIPTIEPILNPIWVMMFIGERPGNWALVGGAIVLAAVTLRCVIVEVQNSRATKG